MKTIRTGVIHQETGFEIMFPVLESMSFPKPLYSVIDDIIEVFKTNPREIFCIAAYFALTKYYASKVNKSYSLTEIAQEFKAGGGVDTEIMALLDADLRNEFYEQLDFIEKYEEAVFGCDRPFSLWYKSDSLGILERHNLEHAISKFGGFEKLVITTDFFSQCQIAWLQYIKERTLSN